jgi:putative chitinase
MINQPVGANAPNNPDDVTMIQALLNLNLPQLVGVTWLAEDGAYGAATHAAIEAFQKTIKATGGIIEPASPTLNALASAITGAFDEIVLEIVMPLCAGTLAALYVDPLRSAMAGNDISTPLRQAHFLAQLGHESGSLRYAAELSSGEQYEGRKDLGNTDAGDGARFKGRGLIQLTGRANYTAYGKARGRDFVTGPNPDLLASDAHLAADCAGWFWNEHSLNAIADADDATKITKVINGGTNGLDDRLRRLRLTKVFLGVT